jgi:uncharacterized protein (TIRG00374 family)
MHSKNMLKIIMLIAGILIVIGIMSIFDMDSIIASLLRSNPLYIIAAFLCQILSLTLLATKIRMIANSQTKKKLTFYESFRAHLSGVLIDFMTPFIQFGGEPVKIYFIKKKLGLSKASAVVAVDDLSEILTFFVMLLISLTLLLLTFPLPVPLIILLISGVSIVAFFIILFFEICSNKKLLGGIVNWVFSVLKKFGISIKGYNHYLSYFEKSFHRLLKDNYLLLKIFILSFFAKFLDFIRMFFVFFALGTIVPINIIIFVWAIILLLSMLPGLPGNLGIIEAGGATAYLMFGLSPSLSASGIILDRFIAFWFVFILGLIIVSFKRNKMP